MSERLERATKLIRDLAALGFHPTGMLVNPDVAEEIDASYDDIEVSSTVSRPLTDTEIKLLAASAHKMTPRTFLGIQFGVQR
jgi:hypothetical protein